MHLNRHKWRLAARHYQQNRKSYGRTYYISEHNQWILRI